MKRINVLISTYWNVNFRHNVGRPRSRCVLISTYWNVNDCECAVLLRPTQSFNLNLLECKSHFQ